MGGPALLRRVFRTAILSLVAWLLAGPFTPSARASELRPETVRAFDHYIELLERRRTDDLLDGKFLYFDTLPSVTRREADAQLRRGDFYIEQTSILESNGAPINVPSGLIHHWIGVAFIPDATYSQTITILLDFNKQQELYKPDVQRSRLLASDGNISRIYVQYKQKSLVTAVLNVEFNTEYLPLPNARGEIRSHSTRVAELADPDEPEGKELPVGNDHGYLWRLNSYWRLEEKNGGLYLEIESVGLSRRIPVFLAWVVNPAVRSLSKAVIANLLKATCKAVVVGAVHKAQS